MNTVLFSLLCGRQSLPILLLELFLSVLFYTLVTMSLFAEGGTVVHSAMNKSSYANRNTTYYYPWNDGHGSNSPLSS